MTEIPVPKDLRRFILTSVESIPYLEAMLLLRSEYNAPWDAARLARRLYISEKKSADLLRALQAAGILVFAGQSASSYCYRPASPELGTMIDCLAEFYASHLVEVTHLVHSKHDKRAEKFANAFLWRKDS